MSQHDFDIANQGFPATRADLNNALKAAVSNSAGTSAPSTTYAYQFWYDSTNNIIKMRNGDNDAWISVATVDQTNDLVSITHTGMLDLVDDDGSASIRFQAPSTVTSTTTFTLPDGDGDSGQTLITNGSGTLAWAAPYGNRNMLINSAMTVAQRSTSATGKTTSGYYSCDRWKTFINNMGTWTVSQSSTTPDGFANSFKLDCTTADASPAAGDFIIVGQILEGQDLQHLKKGTSGALSVTLSFWVRSNKTGTYHIELNDVDNGRTAGAAYTISSADTWEHKSITIAGDTSGAFGNDNGGSLEVLWWLGGGTDFTSGTTVNAPWQPRSGNFINIAPSNVNLADSTSNEWYITGVQLETGDTATDFDHTESYGETLAKCQRYFQTLRGQDRYPGDVGHPEVVFGSANLLQTPMRSQPSLSVSGALSFDEYYVSGRTQSSSHIARNSGNTQCVIASFSNFSSMTRGNPGAIYNANIDIDAEL